MMISADKQAIADCLRDVSDRYILPRFRQLEAGEIETKSSDTDFVTIADKEAEIALTDILSNRYPDATIIGEEACAVRPALKQQANDGLVFTIDPVDGTRNFVHQKERFCSMLALMRDGVPLASWIYLPVSDACYYAEAGAGVYVCDDRKSNFRPLVSTPYQPEATSLDETRGSIGLMGLPETRIIELRPLAKEVKGRQFVGSAGIEILEIAKGQNDYMFHGRTTPWDHAPVALFAAEAGCIVGHPPASADKSAPIAFDACSAAPILVARTSSVFTALNAFITQ